MLSRLLLWHFRIVLPVFLKILLLLFAGSTKTWTQYEKMPVCSMRTALTHFLDITMPPSQAFLQLLATLASRDIDKERLELLAKVNALKPQVLTGAELLAKVNALKPQVLTDAECLCDCVFVS